MSAWKTGVWKTGVWKTGVWDCVVAVVRQLFNVLRVYVSTVSKRSVSRVGTKQTVTMSANHNEVKSSQR